MKLFDAPQFLNKLELNCDKHNAPKGHKNKFVIYIYCTQFDHHKLQHK